ncbi:rubrerythrin-like domain-containing protein [Haloglomus litoreum]|nr:rubrerythrin-like domain-containing protein [Haloglomus sp. DT116]
MLETDPATDDARLAEYECPRCGHRVEATGSVCCVDCETEMQNLGKPRHW